MYAGPGPGLCSASRNVMCRAGWELRVVGGGSETVALHVLVVFSVLKS